MDGRLGDLAGTNMGANTTVSEDQKRTCGTILVHMCRHRDRGVACVQIQYDMRIIIRMILLFPIDIEN